MLSFRLSNLCGVPVKNADLTRLSSDVLKFVSDSAKLCQPDCIYFCDGSEAENSAMLKLLQEKGTLIPLPKYKNCWLARTNPKDVARVESKTFICTEKREDAIPTPKIGIVGKLGNWISMDDYDKAVQERFPGRRWFCLILSFHLKLFFFDCRLYEGTDDVCHSILNGTYRFTVGKGRN